MQSSLLVPYGFAALWTESSHAYTPPIFSTASSLPPLHAPQLAPPTALPPEVFRPSGTDFRLAVTRSLRLSQGGSSVGLRAKNICNLMFSSECNWVIVTRYQLGPQRRVPRWTPGSSPEFPLRSGRKQRFSEVLLRTCCKYLAASVWTGSATRPCTCVTFTSGFEIPPGTE